MEASVSWKGKLTFTGSAESGFNLPLGADTAVGGDEDGFRPMELLAIGLAGCTAMDVISILQKKRQDITAFETLVHAERATEHPKVFTRIDIEYQLKGRQVDPTAVERAIELSTTKYCPAQAMLGQVMRINHTYSIQEVE